MKIPTWLNISINIAMVIAVLIAPTLQELVKHLISHPRSATGIKKPPNLFQKAGGWIFDHTSSPFFFPPLLVALNIALLVFESGRFYRPVTVLTVILISVRVGSIFWCFAWMLVMWNRQELRNLIFDLNHSGNQLTIGLSEDHTKLVRILLEALGDLRTNEPAIEPKPPAG